MTQRTEKLGKTSSIDPKTIFKHGTPAWLKYQQVDVAPPGVTVEWSNPMDPFLRGRKVPSAAHLEGYPVLDPPFNDPFPWQRPTNPGLPHFIEEKTPPILTRYRHWREILVVRSPALGFVTLLSAVAIFEYVFKNQIRSILGFTDKPNRARDNTGPGLM